MRSVRTVAHGIGSAAKIANLTVVAIVGSFRIIAGVAGLAIGFFVRRELATWRFRRRLAGLGLERKAVDAFTEAYRGMVPYPGLLRIRSRR